LLFPALFFCVLNRQPQVISGFLERATNWMLLFPAPINRDLWFGWENCGYFWRTYGYFWE
jgi:hypothetical protein